MKRVWTGCGHSHRRAASVLHGASGSAVWHWTRWWGLPGVWGNAGPGRGHAGDTLLISDSSSSSSFSVIKLPLSYLLLSCIAHLSVVSSPLVCLHHSITFFLLYTKSHVWCGKFAFVTCVCLCLNLPSVSQDCSAFTMLWLREQQWCTRVKCSRDIRALVE